MASPQKENGYVAIATELYEALCRIRINGEARQILDTIIRKTYGFNKKEDAISLSQFVLSTGLKKPTIKRGINKLKEINIIYQKDNAVAQVYGMNKDFDTWKPLSKKITTHKPLSKKIITVIQKDKNRLPKRVPQKTVSKDTITKDIISKDIKDKSSTISTKKKEMFGNPIINEAILAFESHLGGKTDGTATSERRYANHLINALKKEYPDKDPVMLIRHLLQASQADKYLATNCTSFRWLYYNKQKIIQSVKAQKGEKKGIVI